MTFQRCRIASGASKLTRRAKYLAPTNFGEAWQISLRHPLADGFLAQMRCSPEIRPQISQLSGSATEPKHNGLSIGEREVAKFEAELPTYDESAHGNPWQVRVRGGELSIRRVSSKSVGVEHGGLVASVDQWISERTYNDVISSCILSSF